MVSVAPMDSRPIPCLPASRAPVGDATAATASGMPPSEYGASCNLASCNSWVGVLADTVSPASSRTTMSRLVSSSSRVSVGLSPIIAESVGSEPGPTPPMIRPWVRWSSSISRSATQSGLWYESEMTPVPKRIRLARSAAAAMKISGELMISLPAEWCSPSQTSS